MQVTQFPYPLRLWTVEEYHRLTDGGFFHPEERLELLEGQLIRMVAKGTAHTAATRRIIRLLRRFLGEQADVYSQDPIQLNDFSEPEPDIIVVIQDPLDYLNHHPIASEIYLVIEVADSSLKYDCEAKSKAYAKSGIIDYWVLDVNERKLYVFREPSLEGYQQVSVLTEANQVNPSQFPSVTLLVKDMLPAVLFEA